MTSKSGRVVQGLRSGHVRWTILLLLFLSTVSNYLDRQVLSVLAPSIQADLAFSDQAYASIVLAFMVGNTAALFVMGPFMDRVGTRVGFAVVVALWSLACGMHAMATTAFTLGIWRFLLGVGEAGNWPAASKAVAEWFPQTERGIAMGFFNGGVAIGALIAAPLVAWFAWMTGGWRGAFVLSGLTGAVWLVFWSKHYHPPHRHPRISPEEAHIVLGNRVGASAPSPQMPAFARERIARILHCPAFWGIFLARFFTTPIWWFVAYWLPKYLADTHGFGLLQIAAFAWIPFAAADLGNILGGYWSGRLIVGNSDAVSARRLVMGVGSLAMLVSLPTAYARHPGLAILLVSVLTFAYGLWVSNMLALTADSFTPSDVATVVSWTGIGAQAGGAAFTFYIGQVVGGGYWPVFMAVGVLCVLGYTATWFLNRPATSVATRVAHA